MILLVALIGIGTGWLINRASDYFPRFAITRPDALPSAVVLSPPALLRLLRRKSVGDWLWLHALVEAGSAIVFAFLWQQHAATTTLLVYLAAYSFLALVAVIDIKYRLVLNILVYPAMLLVLLAQLLLNPDSAVNVLLGGAFAFIVFYGSALIRPNGLGSGDIKLATLIGLLFAFPGILVVLLIGAGATGIFIAVVLVSRRGGLQTQVPYAPFLCFGALAALLLNLL
jgi:leader peptidase (prepilin peptidase)/N-methyltransferase